MKNPKVSVIMTCYNHEQYIADAIQGIQEQTYSNWELIIIDDCSSDKSAMIADKFACQDSRIRVLRHTYNKGLSCSINDAIHDAEGSYIALHSADDISLPYRLERQVNHFLEYPETVSVSSYVHAIDDKKKMHAHLERFEAIFQRENTPRSKVLHDFFIGGNFINNPSQMIPKKAIEKIGTNRLSLFQLHDYEYNIRLALIGEIYILPEVLLLYRVRDDGNNVSLSNTKGMHCRQFIETYILMDAYLEIQDIPFFMEIFGKYTQRIGKVREETIPYFLAMIAIQHCEEVPKKLWGFRTLYNFLKDESMFTILRKDCGFTYKQFTQLVKKVNRFFS